MNNRNKMVQTAERISLSSKRDGSATAINGQVGKKLEIASVFIDFDGTICPHDVTDLLLERFASSEWEQIEADWLMGKIAARECLSRQIQLISANPDELSAFLDKVCVDPAFPEFIAQLRGAAIPVAIVSDGLDYSIHRILSNYKLDDISVFSNHLVYCGDKSWRLEFPYQDKICPAGNCKCYHIDNAPKGTGKIVYIGDGDSDFCPAAKADIVFAKGKLADFCKKQQIHHIEIENFADILKMWPYLAQLSGRAPKNKSYRAQVAL